MELPFFTIGHSNRSIETFAELLREARVELLVDIRRIPMSRTNPQFNKDRLPDAMAPFQISYQHIAALGGLRSKTPTLPAAINGFWTNKSFHNYADYALSEAFRGGFEELLELGHQRRSAIMCSEAVWWRCHRRIVADYLIVRGETVFHILDREHIEPAHLTPGAAAQADGSVVYPIASSGG
ncbi:DUF488 domain-containing protein [Mesorhizobium sp. SP-1A]|uniref:DUF488 domain-containing protein n=1 Tax=Mesorhizobium sp. SP-1A TaxID=3077840 RepID=UPI0028F6F84B|nr:DUF488 domain-containing protein [Mesorhizobium sp. SP-1A]